MKNIVRIIIFSLLFAVGARANDPSGIQTPIDSGCQGELGFNEATGEWFCSGSAAAGDQAKTCQKSDCPPIDENKNPVLWCQYLKKAGICFKVCTYSSDGSKYYGYAVSSSDCG